MRPMRRLARSGAVLTVTRVKGPFGEDILNYSDLYIVVVCQEKLGLLE